jgi:hypothetical protein
MTWDQFITKATKGIDELPKEESQQLLTHAYQTAVLALRAVVVEGLKAEDSAGLEKAVLEKGDSALFAFGMSHIDNFQQKLSAELERVAEVLVKRLPVSHSVL